MKFYLAIDTEGKKQLRKTQDDIRKVSKTFEQIELPTDSAGLMDLVQSSFNRIFELEGQIRSLEHDLSINSAPAPSALSPAPAPPTQAKPAPSLDAGADKIVDWLFDHASYSQVHDVFNGLSCRFVELMKKAKEMPQEPVEFDDGPTAA